MGDSGKLLNQKFGYHVICPKRVLVGLRRGVLWFVLGELVGRWGIIGFTYMKQRIRGK